MSYREARGFAALLVLSFAALIVILFPELMLQYDHVPALETASQLDSLANMLSKPDYEKMEPVYFSFDPNTLSIDSLLMLGLPQKVAERLHNYLASGGKFVVKEDVRKIYGLSEELFLKLEPYIVIPRQNKPASHLDINQASAGALVASMGIDEQLAGRIVNYRNALGGFVRSDQLEEVYDMPETALKLIKTKTFIARGFKPRRLRINFADADSLSRHPYISAQLAEDIVRFRKINGTIISQTVLAGFKSVDMSNFEKLIFYLDFQ